MTHPSDLVECALELRRDGLTQMEIAGRLSCTAGAPTSCRNALDAKYPAIVSEAAHSMQSTLPAARAGKEA